jgi:hypothetical protein
LKRLLLLVALVCSLTSCGGSQEETSSEEPSEPIQEATLEETTERTTEETTDEVPKESVAPGDPVVNEAAEIVVEPSNDPASAPVGASETPPVITPEQAENRRILAERQATYDGTGPSPWVQGQIDWAREQGLIPADPAADAAVQSQKANNGQGEGANMCGIAPDATWYGEPC